VDAKRAMSSSSFLSGLFNTLLRVSLKQGFAPERVGRCAQLFAGAYRDGVYSHDLDRFPRFLSIDSTRALIFRAERADYECSV